MLGLYGGADTGIPNDTVEKMKAALKDAKQAGGDRPLSRHAARLPRRLPADLSQEEAAKDGWKRLLEWFKKQGV